MVPGKYNMTCPQGSTFTQVMVYYVDDVATDLTTYTARMQVREKHTSIAVIAELTTENGKIVFGDDGSISLSLSADETAQIIAKEYVYDLELVNGDIVTRIVEGSFFVTPEVTR